ncbi:hypothetical protein F5Y04DRAFT_284738 [Hypomontagnella monticulosa]|nr:hypothetical protein F5Y04DRAFT_284738 [Hypomontagnella monticulosa]
MACTASRTPHDTSRSGSNNPRLSSLVSFRSSFVFVISLSMDQYRLKPKDLPSWLYRVQYPESQTGRDSEGLFAADMTTAFRGDDPLIRELFKQAVQNHFTWSYRDSSPFISFFSDRRHAINWGRKEPWDSQHTPRLEWALCTIDTCTSQLRGVEIFKVEKLVDVLGVKIPEGARQHQGGAYICLHEIPACAIVQSEPASTIRISTVPTQPPTKADVARPEVLELCMELGVIEQWSGSDRLRYYSAADRRRVRYGET